MNKFFLMVVLTLTGCGGALVRGPFVPLAFYYLYGVLRPQFIWKWALVSFPEFGWSFYLALSALLSYPAWLFGVVGPRDDPDRRVHPPFVWAHRLFLGFAVWVGISYLYANNQLVAEKYFEEFSKIVVMYLLATQVIRSVRQVWVLYMLITLALGYITYEVNELYLTTGYLLLFKQGYAGLDNNGAALMLAMGVPLLYFAWEMTRGWYRWAFLALIPLVVHAVVSSYSRGAMLSVLLTVPLYFLYTRRRGFLLRGVVVMTMLLPFVAGNEIQERFFSVSEAEADESFNSRQVSWRCARLIANDYPIFGAGPRCSNLLTQQYGADMYGRTIHNNYLQIAADNGWLGLFWYAALIGYCVFSMWRARVRLWNVPTDDARRAVAMLGGMECALWTFLIGAMALSLETFELPYILMLMGAQVWALCNAQVSPPPGVRHLPPPVPQTFRRPPPPPAPRRPAPPPSADRLARATQGPRPGQAWVKPPAP